ncbi:MAG: hypothetical protein GY717_07800 [Rhodobacteraceae bacterium]|nr:hypothetical protein [Paracoccaceae bacterium]
MKAPALLAAIAVTASAMAASAGEVVIKRIVPADREIVMLTPSDLFEVRPTWAYKVDRSILYPKRPFPWPVPPCLSCPPFEMPGMVMIMPVIR